MTDKRCPQCGTRVHRSRSRGVGEKVVKALTSYRPYRCYECGWRGWRGGRDSLKRRRMMQTIIGLLITLLITTLVALYVVRSMRLVE